MVDTGLTAEFEALEISGENPTQEFHEKFGKCGLLALCAGLSECKHIPEPTVWGMAGIKTDQLDLFHVFIATAERSRLMTPGAEDAVSAGITIGFGPVRHFGQDWMQQEIVPKLLMGKKRICLAITEPYAGKSLLCVSLVDFFITRVCWFEAG